MADQVTRKSFTALTVLITDDDLEYLRRTGSFTARCGGAYTDQKGELIGLCHQGSTYLGRIKNVVPVTECGLADVTYELVPEIDHLRALSADLLAALKLMTERYSDVLAANGISSSSLVEDARAVIAKAEQEWFA